MVTMRAPKVAWQLPRAPGMQGWGTGPPSDEADEPRCANERSPAAAELFPRAAYHLLSSVSLDSWAMLVWVATRLRYQRTEKNATRPTSATTPQMIGT